MNLKTYYNLQSTQAIFFIKHTSSLCREEASFSFNSNYYALVIVDDFSRFTGTLFLESKSDAFSAFKKYAKRLQNINCSDICAIRNDHEGQFQNEKFSFLV